VVSPLWTDERGPDGGPLVVLVHGSMDRSTSFGRVARRLQDDSRVVRYDRRGYGRSARVGGPYTVEQHGRDLVDVLDGRRAAVVMGHSFGAVVALLVAHRHPELVDAVVAYEPPFSWEPWWPRPGTGPADDPEIAAERFMRRMVGDRVWERMPSSARDARREEGAAMLAEAADLRARPPFDVDALSVTLVAAHGSRSEEHHQRATIELALRVPGTPIVRVEEADHGAHLTHPQELVAVIRLAQGLAAR